MILPTKIFLTKGVGIHKDKLLSFDLALRDAGIAKYNLVTVSSIFPPNCKILSKEEGIRLLKPGQILFCVLSKNETNEPNKLISSAIGIASPNDSNYHGYLSEYHSSDETIEEASNYAEDQAATMLATILSAKFDSFKTTSICQSAHGSKDGLWTTTIAAVVLIE